MFAPFRRKSIPWVLGLVLLAVSIVAANQFVLQAQTPPGSTATPAPRVNAIPPSSGITVKGVVDTPEGIHRVDAPAVASASLTVKAVLVKDGDAVQIGTPLIQFDDTFFREKVNQAAAGVEEAKWQATIAQAQRDNHPKLIDAKKNALDATRTELKFAEDGYKIAREVFENFLKTEKYIENGVARPLNDFEKDKRRRENLELLKQEGLIELLKKKVQNEADELERLKTLPADAELGRAQANVALREAQKKEAEQMRDSCLVRASVEGIIEQVNANAGMTFGPATRSPAMLIIPSGPRVVRAEVEAEFAFKIANTKGQPVTIYDDHNFDITYPGVVERISPAFLPRRGSQDTFTVGPANRVLEVLIRVTDAAPKGKPPLLPGLPVRVGFTTK